MGGSAPTMAPLIGAFAKRLRKNPPEDDDILGALIWIERMVETVRGVDGTSVEDLPTLDDTLEITPQDFDNADTDDDITSLIPQNW